MEQHILPINTRLLVKKGLFKGEIYTISDCQYTKDGTVFYTALNSRGKECPVCYNSAYYEILSPEEEKKEPEMDYMVGPDAEQHFFYDMEKNCIVVCTARNDDSMQVVPLDLDNKYTAKTRNLIKMESPTSDEVEKLMADYISNITKEADIGMIKSKWETEDVLAVSLLTEELERKEPTTDDKIRELTTKISLMQSMLRQAEERNRDLEDKLKKFS